MYLDEITLTKLDERCDVDAEQADTVLHTNDNVLVVTNKDEVSAMQILFGSIS